MTATDVLPIAAVLALLTLIVLWYYLVFTKAASRSDFTAMLPRQQTGRKPWRHAAVCPFLMFQLWCVVAGGADSEKTIQFFSHTGERPGRSKQCRCSLEGKSISFPFYLSSGVVLIPPAAAVTKWKHIKKSPSFNPFLCVFWKAWAATEWENLNEPSTDMSDKLFPSERRGRDSFSHLHLPGYSH